MTQIEKGKAPAKAAEVKAAEAKKVFVRTPVGQMVHLFTNVVFTTDPKKVDLDGFVQAQLDAGKLVIAED